MPDPKLTSYLDVDFATLKDIRGNRMTKSWQGFPSKGIGSLLVIDLAPSVEWPHSCFWIAMTNVEKDGSCTTGFRPWCWPPALEADPEEELDRELDDYLDTLDPGDDEVPRSGWDKEGPRPDLPLEECPLMGTDCPVCGEPLHDTPSGSLCKNGHGGV